MKRKTLILFFLPGLMACTKPPATEGIVRIEYGTSFGECLGYCIHYITMEESLITYTRDGWGPDIEKENCTEVLADTTWNSIRKAIDTALFFDLPETIGCPDCADGGAEWIEIVMGNGRLHKVTFEYRNEPEALEYVYTLRQLLTKENECGLY